MGNENDGGGGVGRLSLDGSGAALSPNDALRHLGLTVGGQLQVVAEPMTIQERLTAAKKKKIEAKKNTADEDGYEDPAAAADAAAAKGSDGTKKSSDDRVSKVDAGGDHDGHGRSVGSSKGSGGKGKGGKGGESHGGGVVPLHYTPQSEMASIRPGPILGQLKTLVKDGQWRPEEDASEVSVTRLPDGVHPEPFKYIRVWKSGLTRQQCRRIIKDAERVNEWKGYSAFGDGVKTQDVGVEKLSEKTNGVVSEMLERLRDFVHKKFIVNLPELDGARMVRGGTGQKIGRDDPDHGFAEPVNLKGIPFVIKYNASDASSSLYTHKVGVVATSYVGCYLRQTLLKLNSVKPAA